MCCGYSICISSITWRIYYYVITKWCVNLNDTQQVLQSVVHLIMHGTAEVEPGQVLAGQQLC